MLTLLKAFLVAVAEGAGYQFGRWFMGQILDVAFVCHRCGEQFSDRIGNQQSNHLGCTNCWAETIQFTNACNFTLGANGQIAHAGAKLLGGWSIDRQPSTGRKYQGWAFFSTVMKANNFQGKQFVVAGAIVDYNSGMVYTKKDQVYAPNYETAVWSDNFTVALRWEDVPEYARDGRVLAVDLQLKSEWGDPLWKDRRLAGLWS